VPAKEMQNERDEEMFNEGLKDLEIISHAVGNCPDYVQGGGGNSSVKLNDELMAVKASGFKLNQITSKEGFVVVNYKKIKEYHENVDLNSGIDYEKDSVQFAKDNVVELEGIEKLRPSVEAGFHSVLKKYVIHTHPVYANILCCSEEGRELVSKIFPEDEWNILWIPYVNPGFFLTLKIMEGIKAFQERSSKESFPEVIFMQNHGLIVTSDDRDKCIELHSKVNNRIKEYLGIKESYPEIKIEKIQADENTENCCCCECCKGYTYESKTDYLLNFFKGKDISKNIFEEIKLYPDQLVYLNDSVSVDGEKNKLNIDTKTGQLLYCVDYKEALTIEETLLAYVYVIDKVKQCGLTIKSMTEEEVDYIRNWESEKYRRKMVGR